MDIEVRCWTKEVTVFSFLPQNDYEKEKLTELEKATEQGDVNPFIFHYVFEDKTVPIMVFSPQKKKYNHEDLRNLRQNLLLSKLEEERLSYEYFLDFSLKTKHDLPLRPVYYKNIFSVSSVLIAAFINENDLVICPNPYLVVFFRNEFERRMGTNHVDLNLGFSHNELKYLLENRRTTIFNEITKMFQLMLQQMEAETFFFCNNKKGYSLLGDYNLVVLPKKMKQFYDKNNVFPYKKTKDGVQLISNYISQVTEDEFSNITREEFEKEVSMLKQQLTNKGFIWNSFDLIRQNKNGQWEVFIEPHDKKNYHTGWFNLVDIKNLLNDEGRILTFIGYENVLLQKIAKHISELLEMHKIALKSNLFIRKHYNGFQCYINPVSEKYHRGWFNIEDVFLLMLKKGPIINEIEHHIG